MRRLLALIALIAPLFAAPSVEKVEPPNWWVGHSFNPVRLLIQGKGLNGAAVKCAAKGVAAGNVKTSANGNYLFVDVEVRKDAKPGSYPLEITTSEGRAVAPFSLQAPLDRKGRFQGFSDDDVIYLIMPDRFANGDVSNDDPAISRGLYDRTKSRYYHGGDLAGIRARLPYLKQLGVTAIWMTPVYDNANKLNSVEKYDGAAITDYHGYGAVDYYAVEEHLGTLAEFQKLTDAAHAAGIKVIQDQVANHTGPYHRWARDWPTPTWYNGSPQEHLANTWQIWTLMDPHSPAALRKSTLDGWFLNILPDLNQNDPETARYLIQNTLWWIASVGLDAIRQDTLPYVPREFWREWMRAIKREYPGFRVVGEMWDEDPSLVAFFQGGKARYDGIDSGIDGLFDFPLYGAVRRVFARQAPMQELAKVLAHDHLYEDPNLLVTFLGLHDTNRFMNERGATLSGLRMAFTFLMTTRGIPMIYYGDEIGMPGGNDPDNRRDFPGGWSTDARNAFEPAGRTPEEQSLFAHLQRLAALRAGHAALRHGKTTQLNAAERTCAYMRGSGSAAVLVAFNTGDVKATLPLPLVAAGLAEGAVLHDETGTVGDVRVSGAVTSVELPPNSAAVFTVK